MHRTNLREATQVCLRSCCPNPIVLNIPAEPEQQQHHHHQPVVKPRNSSSTCRHDFATKTATTLFPNTAFTNHESIPSLQDSFHHFIKSYPNYSHTATVDRIRERDYPHLSNHVCLDYIGVGLFSQSQFSRDCFPSFDLDFKMVNLKRQLLVGGGGGGSELEFTIKKRIMDVLNICEDDYSMVFTANGSSAFKLVAESYPFQSNRKLLTVYDQESEAVSGMISTSEKRGSRPMSAEFKWPRLRVHSSKLRKMIMTKNKKKQNRGLFVFPLQSRTTGVGYSYQWMRLAQEHGWHVLLDACALGPKDMDSFGLSLFRPDFLVCSFYKVFGENPSGFGCLFVKKSVLPALQDSVNAGIVSITPAKNLFDSSGSTDTELEQIKITNLTTTTKIECRCLDQVDSLGLLVIGSRGRYLINWLVSAMMKLQHPNRVDNFPLVTIHGPNVKFERGSALAFNLYDWKGEKVDPILVQKLADRNNISLGHGVLHHIWFPDKTQDQTKSGKLAVVTAALTFLTNFQDVYKLWAFVAQFLDADFVEKERWRYTALNQHTVEVL